MPRFTHYLALLLVLLLSSCKDTSNTDGVLETEEKPFLRGQRLLREGREDEALSAFLRVIEKRPEAPESHLEAGQLYQQYEEDPVTAIYHYRRFIALKPNSKEAQRVQQLIESARKDFAKTLPAQPFRNDLERLDLLEMLEDLREENLALKAQLRSTPNQLPLKQEVAASKQANPVNAPALITLTEPLVKPTPSSTQSAVMPTTTLTTYNVVTGDTLSQISTKVYGDPRHWMVIFEANRDRLPNPNALRVGQALNIPQL